MYLPLCKQCKSCIYFRDIGIGFCVHPDRFESKKVNLSAGKYTCSLFLQDPLPDPDTKMIPITGSVLDGL